MKKRLTAAAVSITAIAAAVVLSALVHVPAACRSPLRGDLTARPVGRQLPRGFTLPSADVELNVLSLVTTDLDADGDLDIVAADRSSDGVDIVVWVNDGDGRLTRKAPGRSTNVASEPGSPRLDQREAAAIVSLLPDGPPVDTTAVGTWLEVSAHRCDPLVSTTPQSITRCTLRSRSPPALS